jgi:hypothetical protein
METHPTVSGCMAIIDGERKLEVSHAQIAIAAVTPSPCDQIAFLDKI